MPVLTCFFCNDTAPTEIYTLSLHDALPIYLIVELSGPEPPILDGSVQPYFEALEQAGPTETGGEPVILSVQAPFTVTQGRSEEHTSELQSQSNLVCRLLLEKKNINV